MKYLAATRHIDAFDWPRNFEGSYDTIFTTLFFDVFAYIFVFFFVFQLIIRNHIQQTKNLKVRRYIHKSVYFKRLLFFISVWKKEKIQTSVGGPDVPTMVRPGTWIVTGTCCPVVAFFAPTLALCTISFLSPNCIPFRPAIAYVTHVNGLH